MSALIWLVLAIGFLVVETLTLAFAAVYVAAGALAAATASAAHAPVWVQVGVLAAVAGLLPALTRPLLVGRMRRTRASRSCAVLPGEIAVVVRDISPPSVGQVRVG